MLFNSMQYLIFFPVVFFAYFLLPRRVRPYWLLAASYYFYMCWNAKYALLMLFSTVVTYLGGLALSALQKHGVRAAGQRAVLVSGVLLALGVLFWFKYLDFAMQNLALLLQALHMEPAVPRFDILLPVGISFYTFQALGYLIDVYRGQTEAEKSFFKYALFVSFFPQLVAGPIERSSNLLSQINEPRDFCAADAKRGLLQMAYGLFCKIVVADNIAAIIDPLFGNYLQQSGMMMLLATMLFAVQVYCDFNGYTQIAIGSARVLGFRLMENFNAPYMALNIRDFWKRWHISLTSWFRDYLYIPLGGNRKGKGRQYLNNLIVFLCSGLWHGAAWHYVVWGGLNGLYVVLQDATRDLRPRLYRALRLPQGGRLGKFAAWSGTFLLVDISWLFFRADSVGAAAAILRAIVQDLHPLYILSDNAMTLFPDVHTAVVLLVSLAAVFIADRCKDRGISIGETVFAQPALVRWAWYILVIFVIIMWGAYGDGYQQTQFIYFQF